MPNHRRPYYCYYFSAMNILAFLFILFNGFISSVNSLNLGKCHTRALGMESGEIIDEQISASSSFDVQSVGPQNARIRSEKASGAWCPKSQIKNSSYEFLQVSLNSTHIIQGIETQGRYGNGTGAEYVNEYYIDYYRFGAQWIRYKNRTGHSLLYGNSDTTTAVLQTLDPPIIASKIRIVPHSEQTRTMCLRLELHGCEDFDSLVAYSLNREGSGDLRDRIFEDTKDVDTIMGGRKGLGILTDGIIATNSPSDSNGKPYTNSTWIGWSQNSTLGKIIVIFEFEKIKNFTDVEIFAWGEPIDLVEVEFSKDGNAFSPENTVRTRYPRADLTAVENPKGYSIHVPLPNRNGKFVRIRLNFQGKWIYLTEVNFNTVLLNETIDEFTGATQYYGMYYIIVGLLILLFLFFMAILCIMCLFKRKNQNKKKFQKTSKQNGAYKSGLLVTTLGANGIPRNHIQQLPPSQNILNQLSSNFYGAKSNATDKDSLQRILSHSSRSCSSGTVSKDTPPSLLDIHFPPPPSTNSSESTSEHHVYSEPSQPLLHHQHSNHRQHSQNSKSGVSSSSANNTPTRRRRSTSQNRTLKTLPINNRPSIVSEENDLYGTPSNNVSISSHSFENELVSIVRIPRKSIILGPQIGEGKFTSIHTCEVSGISTTAVIKLIKDNAEDVEAGTKALYCEAQILAALEHPNLIKLYGVCDDYSVIIEHIPHGNIRDFIITEKDKITFGSLLHFCTNIANGMKYLEQARIVHGHLSPRNCLIESNLNVKIAAPRGPLHHAQLRYSAPESIILNEWTHKSDAWSFAVTAWEILHFCERIPFECLTNPELVDHAKSVVEGLPLKVKLDFNPNYCPAEIRDLLLECCGATPETRPAFLEIQLFLSRKAMSFTLQHKRQRPPGLIIPQSLSMYR